MIDIDFSLYTGAYKQLLAVVTSRLVWAVISAVSWFMSLYKKNWKLFI